MMEKDLKSLLKKKNLRVTKTRLDILQLFYNAAHALTQPDIERKLGDDPDKVTIYRTLHAFEEKCIIHQVPGESRSAMYALTPKKNNDEFPDHGHFYCTECKRTFCLGFLNDAFLLFPDNHRIKSISVLAEGICENCKKKINVT